MLEEIERVFHDRDLGRGLAGARNVWRLLVWQLSDGIVDAELGPVAPCTVERLMRSAGLSGVRRGGPKVVTSRADGSAPLPSDLVDRDFHADAPNRFWVVDSPTSRRGRDGVHRAFVSDVFSRRIVGWRTATPMLTQLPLDALEMALWTRARAGHTDERGRLEGLIHHSDAGPQYTTICCAERLADAGAMASIGSVGDSYDNVLAESGTGLYQT